MINISQRRIQDFLNWGANQTGDNLLCGQNLLKTAGKWRKLDREGRGRASKISLCRSATDLNFYLCHIPLSWSSCKPLTCWKKAFKRNTPSACTQWRIQDFPEVETTSSWKILDQGGEASLACPCPPKGRVLEWQRPWPWTTKRASWTI